MIRIGQRCTPSLLRATVVALAAAGAGGCGDSPGATGPLTGDINVVVTTTGATIDVDPDGYAVVIDGGASQGIPVNFAMSVPNLAAGSHLVLLTGLEANCSVDGINPRSIDVRGGRKSPASVAFVVSCKANTGSIEVSASTSGPDPDPTGYSVVVGGGSAHVASNGSRNISNLRAGTHDVFLTDLAGNCVVEGPNPLKVNVTFGTAVQVAFSVRCVKEARLAVGTVTSGVAVDPDGYVLELRSEGRGDVAPVYFAMPTNGSVAVTGLLPGAYVLSITGVMANCDVASNRQTVMVSAETATPVSFQVSCNAPGRLAFVNYSAGGGADIHTVNSDGTGITRLTNTDFRTAETDPTWSPDGSSIAFSLTRDMNAEIYVMNADGTNQIRLTTAAGLDIKPAWSPDGSRIAFVSQRDANDYEIYVMNADGTNQIRLTNRNGYDMSPAWSPDGTRIVFESDREGSSEIWVMNSDGSGAIRLTSSDFGSGRPAWSPDGSKIAFSRGMSSSRSAIFTMNAAGSDVTRVSDVFDWATDPTWSPDGRKIAFGGLETYNYYTAYWPLIFVIGIDGTPYSSPSNLTAIDLAWRPR